MNDFGRLLDTTAGNFARGAPLAIEGPDPINTYPVLNLDGQPHLVERQMFQAGAVENPPQHAHWTNAAAGGCVPICATEVAPGFPRQVRWLYLFHGHGGNMGINIAAGATNPQHVYVAFLLYAPRNGIWENYSFTARNEFFHALDPYRRANARPARDTVAFPSRASTAAARPNSITSCTAGSAKPAPRAAASSWPPPALTHWPPPCPTPAGNSAKAACGGSAARSTTSLSSAP